ncbi:9761_t:CDS:2, partial [Racocetra fulgida]
MRIITQETGIELTNEKITNQSGKSDYEVMTNLRHKSISSIISYEQLKDNLQKKNIADFYNAISLDNNLSFDNNNDQVIQNNQTMIQGFKTASELLN